MRGYAASTLRLRGGLTKKRRRGRKVGRKQLIIIGIAMCMLMGLIIGSIYALTLGADEYGGIQTKLERYIQSLAEPDGAFSDESFGEFRESLLKYGKTAVIIWFLALLPAGGLISAGLFFLRGFGYGFTTAALFRCYGSYGLVYAALLYLIQALILVPTYGYMVYYCVDNTSFASDEPGLANYFATLFIGFMLCLIAGAADAFVTPRFL